MRAQIWVKVEKRLPVEFMFEAFDFVCNKWSSIFSEVWGVREDKSIVKNCSSFFFSKVAGVSRQPENSAHLRVSGLQLHHRNSKRNDTPKEKKKEWKMWDREKKRSKFWAVRWGESGEGVPWRGRAPKSWNAPTKILNIPPHHTTQHHTTTTTHHTTQRGFPHKARSMAQKTRHEQPIVPKTSPFLWCQNFAQI